MMFCSAMEAGEKKKGGAVQNYGVCLAK